MTKPDTATESQPPADSAPTTGPTTAPTTGPATAPADSDAGTDKGAGDEGTDWKAEARKWEGLAKENKNAAKELETLKAAAMTEQEKAVAEAKAAGLAEAASTYGARIAGAELKAAAASKGLDLSALDDLIDAKRFVNDAGEVDSAAIKTAVDKLARTFAGPRRSGGDFNGGNGSQQITREQLASMTPAQIATAQREGKLSHLM